MSLPTHEANIYSKLTANQWLNGWMYSELALNTPDIFVFVSF